MRPLALPASIPSPAQGVWYLGPVPLRAYALCIILGVVVGVWLGERRWVARGGRAGTVSDLAVWAVPFGLVGARIYHVVTDPELYFGPGRSPVQALYVWQGGLGVWGAVALGAVGAYVACRRSGARFPAMADAVAPGILFGQAIGRWGNYFNQELFGRPSTAPWALQIDPQNRPPGYTQYQTFHPTFLYESLWDATAAFVVLWADRRFRLGHGRAFALYGALYTAGRFWIELLRIDTANTIGPFRLNVWTALLLFAVSVIYFVVVGRRLPGRESCVQPRGGDSEDAGKGSHTLADTTGTST